jgi:hypothetical protein
MTKKRFFGGVACVLAAMSLFLTACEFDFADEVTIQNTVAGYTISRVEFIPTSGPTLVYYDRISSGQSKTYSFDSGFEGRVKVTASVYLLPQTYEPEAYAKVSGGSKVTVYLRSNGSYLSLGL